MTQPYIFAGRMFLEKNRLAMRDATSISLLVGDIPGIQRLTETYFQRPAR